MALPRLQPAPSRLRPPSRLGSCAASRALRPVSSGACARVPPAARADPQRDSPVPPQPSQAASSGLDEDQRAAVQTTASTVRVKAGPGSGKTRVVVARALHLVAHRGVRPHRILAITFTNKAVVELKERFEQAAKPEEAVAGGASAAAHVPSGHEQPRGAGLPAGAHAAGAAWALRSRVASKTFHRLGLTILRSALSTSSSAHPTVGLKSGFAVMDDAQGDQLLLAAVLEVEGITSHEQQRGGSKATEAQQRPPQQQPSSGQDLPGGVPVLTKAAARKVVGRIAASGFFGALKVALAAEGHFDDDSAFQFAAEKAGVVPPRATWPTDDVARLHWPDQDQAPSTSGDVGGGVAAAGGTPSGGAAAASAGLEGIFTTGGGGGGVWSQLRELPWWPPSLQSVYDSVRQCQTVPVYDSDGDALYEEAFASAPRPKEDPDARLAETRWCIHYLNRYYAAYQRLLRRHNAVDFCDLISLPVRLLATHPQLLRQWRARFDHILVDEFQDTDPAQYALVRLLRRPDAGLFVVGDPDQAIYGWRGAEVGNMTTYLPRDFPDTHTCLLGTNYRSLPHIMDAADCLLQAMYKQGQGGQQEEGPGVAVGPALYKRAIVARPRVHGAEVTGTVYADDKDEARGIAARITLWQAQHSSSRRSTAAAATSEDFPRHEVAVLYRLRVQSRPLEEALTLKGIPFVVIGGQPFWEYKEIRDAMAYLHVVADPTQSDIFLDRIINEPARGLGPEALRKLEAAAKANWTTLGGLLFDDMLLSDQERRARGAAAEAAAAAGTVGAGQEAPAAATPARLTRRRAGAESVSGGAVKGRRSAAGGGCADVAPPLEDAGAAAALGPDARRHAPDIPSWSPLAAVRLTKRAMEGVQELRGLVAAARGALVGGRRVVEVLRGCLTLSTYEVKVRSDVEKGEGRKRTVRAKKDMAEEARERLERLSQLFNIAKRPMDWINADTQAEYGVLEGGAEEEWASASSSVDEEELDVGLPGLVRFLEHSALFSSQDVDEATGARNAVRLMTLHSAKGLEFERVFIVGLEEGILPSVRAESREEKGEEQRLLYVGTTRAKDVLLLSRCEARMMRGKEKRYPRSSFLKALQVPFSKHRT